MKTLFDKTIINKMELKNRLMRSATWENMADQKGHLTDRLIKLYEDLAKGGIGLIITSAIYLTENSKSLNGQLGLYSDEFIGEYKEFTSMIHKYGSKVLAQMSYASLKGEMLKPTDVTTEDIKAIATDFGDAAARAEKAGFDGVEIHAAHGFFLSQFLSSIHNQRRDNYGGNLENNSRIILEIYDEIRKRTSKDFIIFIKVNSIDANDYENAFKVCKYTCIQLSIKGIDGIEISGGNDITEYKESIYRDYAAEIAAEIQTPVILVGKNRTPDVMNEILNTTAIQYFSLSRPLISESNLVNLWEEDSDKAPKCISCGKCMNENGLMCIFNR
ncbi:NADH:flavin oxidoreductase [Clostridium pasteurianum]|uniref:NADH:flavin oxidoreductase n=1 Tax=Clostridium pasteurianum BC1 TaxID=86416 RepID=R4K943_CLOPA|nr:NADH:flavin oxidoreductase [Clostridium pasteurianum]AGK96165.1 NADH:flavin oxidoreductase [Clostridium pasteurianum BC1]